MINSLVIKTPYSKLNNALGTLNGVERGKLVLVKALNHNYRLGLLIDLYLGHAMCNKPQMIDSTKKATIVDVVNLDSTNSHLKVITSRYENITGESTDANGLNIDNEHYDHRLINYGNKGDYSTQTLFKFIEELEERGAEIHQVTIHDVHLMKSYNSHGIQISLEETIWELRKFFGKRQTLVIISTEMDDVIPKELHLAAEEYLTVLSKTNLSISDTVVTQAVDCELLMGLSNGVCNGESHVDLHVVVTKHRGSAITDPWCVHRFDTEGYLPFDAILED